MSRPKPRKGHVLQFDALAIHVAHHGARAAAWLVRDQKAAFHRAGQMEFKIARTLITPPWFRVAFEFLCLRKKKWAVKLVKTAKERVYRVQWLAWRRYARRV